MSGSRTLLNVVHTGRMTINLFFHHGTNLNHPHFHRLGGVVVGRVQEYVDSTRPANTRQEKRPLRIDAFSRRTHRQSSQGRGRGEASLSSRSHHRQARHPPYDEHGCQGDIDGG